MHCWARSLFYAVVTVLALGQMISACGQSGDLYLPDEAETRDRPISLPSGDNEIPAPDEP